MRSLATPLALLTLSAAGPVVSSQTVHLDPHVVTASRTPQAPGHVSVTVTLLDAEAIRRAPTATLDAALRSVPGFSLFRRSDSLTANPTGQGVSLRGLGPSGASRSLILLDGVPLNDPFGGWVAWSKVPREGLSRIELVPGGGATAWGNAALGGVVQVISAPPSASGGAAVAVLGDYGTRSAELSLAHEANRDTLQLRGRMFSTDGFGLVAPEHRGPVDIPAWSRHRWISGNWQRELGTGVALAAILRHFEEERGNGTPYQRNASRENFLSLRASGQPAPGFSWHAVGYLQDQTFASTFGSINALRTLETPASEQYAVPSDALGAAWTGHWEHAPAQHTSMGFDFREVAGETRERFAFSNGAFTRSRTAGGRQRVAGGFALHDRLLAPGVRMTAGIRWDSWRDSGGHRRELELATGAGLRNDVHPDRDGSALSPSFGLIWRPQANLRLRANLQRAYRRPTLNELYRPFRVGPNVTEANPDLDTERVNSGEFGVEWTVLGRAGGPSSAISSPPIRGPAPPAFTLGVVAFRNDLRDVVGNVTIARGPGTFPLVGFIAAGGVGRQRLNLERSRVQGFELSARWRTPRGAAFSADYLCNDATVTRSAAAPALAGLRIAQVPRHSASLGAVLEAGAGLVVTPRIRWIGRQFEDDENELVLGEVVVADFGVSRSLGTNLEVFLNLENLGDVRVETGRTAGGLVNIGAPRLAMLGVRGSW